MFNRLCWVMLLGVMIIGFGGCKKEDQKKIALEGPGALEAQKQETEQNIEENNIKLPF